MLIIDDASCDDQFFYAADTDAAAGVDTGAAASVIVALAHPLAMRFQHYIQLLTILSRTKVHLDSSEEDGIIQLRLNIKHRIHQHQHHGTKDDVLGYEQHDVDHPSAANLYVRHCPLVNLYDAYALR